MRRGSALRSATGTGTGTAARPRALCFASWVGNPGGGPVRSQGELDLYMPRPGWVVRDGRTASRRNLGVARVGTGPVAKRNAPDRRCRPLMALLETGNAGSKRQSRRWINSPARSQGDGGLSHLRSGRSPGSRPHDQGLPGGGHDRGDDHPEDDQDRSEKRVWPQL